LWADLRAKIALLVFGKFTGDPDKYLSTQSNSAAAAHLTLVPATIDEEISDM